MGLKILQIIQRPQLRGAEIFACQLTKQLKDRGHIVDVLCLFHQENNLLHFELNFLSLRAQKGKRFTDFKSYKRLAEIIKEGKYDIVQANAGDTLKYAAISKSLFGWNNKLVFRNANKMSAFIKNRLHGTFNKLFLSRVDYVISVSENCRQDLIKFYPKLSSISDTATIGTFTFDAAQPSHPSSNNFIWINIGSFVPEKNHSFLLKLFSHFSGKYTNTELWLVGSGQLEDDLKKMANDLGLSSTVKFLGYRKDVIPLLKSSSLMVMPSKIEGLPGVILEAMSCGIPVVASDVGGIPEVVRDGETGFVIKGESVQEYLDKVENLYKEYETYQRFSEKGMTLIKSEFLMPSITNRFESIYSRLIKEGI